MEKLWYIKYLLGRYNRELLFWYHRMNHCNLNTLIRLSKRVIINKNVRKTRKLPPCMACLFGKSNKRPWRTKVKHTGGSIRNILEARTRAIT